MVPEQKLSFTPDVGLKSLTSNLTADHTLTARQADLDRHGHTLVCVWYCDGCRQVDPGLYVWRVIATVVNDSK